MKLICEMNDPIVKKACILVQNHYQDEDFLKLIENVSRFNGTEMTSLRISGELRVAKHHVFYVKPYKTRLPWSRTIGYFKNPNCYINTRKKLPLKDRIETIFHECIGHGLGFSHNGNYATSENLKSFPYLGAALFLKHLQEVYKSDEDFLK